ncbi:hypothetical protein CDLVIII_4311 [Clostridium sp. DL-VIII]|uniref:hypothetical protein n=1 Tax=Clostridium sp. DL-VIII TaxID=641107 RepID=UPI00023B0530|nr:hypothetical protein [Clostridium sp. DL-VIII]EHJ00827.1 hypothetical protein CDLVIII_4311 [Clostridium sp. DL-VIII]
MDSTIVLLILALVIAGTVYFSIEYFEDALQRSIMRNVILLLLFILIELCGLMYMSGYYNCEELISIVFISEIDLCLMIFSLVETIYRKFKL